MKNLLITIIAFILTVSGSAGQQIINDWLVLGKNSIQQGNFVHALRNYNLYIDENPNDPIGYLYRSKLYEATGRNQESQLDLQIARRLNPLSLMYISPVLRSKYSAKKTYSYLYDNLNADFTKSVTKYDEYVKLLTVLDASHSQDVMILDIIKALEEKDVDKAEQLLEQVQFNDINKFLYYDLAGKIALKRKDLGKAIENFTIAIGHNPKFSISYHNRGIAHKLSGNYAEAKSDLSKAIELNNDIALFYFSYAKLSEVVGDNKAAMQRYENALELQSDYSEALANYSSLLKGLGEYDEGLNYLNQAIHTNDDASEKTFLKANLHFTYGEYEKAIEEYEIYLDDNSKDADAIYNMGLSKLLIRRNDDGCSDLELSLDIHESELRQQLYSMFCNSTSN